MQEIDIAPGANPLIRRLFKTLFYFFILGSFGHALGFNIFFYKLVDENIAYLYAMAFPREVIGILVIPIFLALLAIEIAIVGFVILKKFSPGWRAKGIIVLANLMTVGYVVYLGWVGTIRIADLVSVWQSLWI